MERLNIKGTLCLKLWTLREIGDRIHYLTGFRHYRIISFNIFSRPFAVLYLGHLFHVFLSWINTAGITLDRHTVSTKFRML